MSLGAYTLALSLAGALLALLALLFVWSRTVEWYYRLPPPRPEQLRVVCSDGWELAIFRRKAAKKRFREPVLLCHGLAANHVNFDLYPPHSLAHCLSDAGFDCYTVEWRGTGASAAPPPARSRGDYNIDDHIRLDAPAVVRFVAQEAGASGVFWVGHSLGGLIGYGAAQNPHLAQEIRGLVTLGSPAFFAHHRPLLRRALDLGVLLAWPKVFHQRWVSAMLAPFLGHVTLPLSEIVINPEHIPPRLQRQLYALMISSVSRKVLLQFRHWFTQDRFESADGRVDYRAGLSRVTIPLLVMGGSQDALAPTKCLEAAFDRIGSTKKTLMIFGKDRGDKMNYGHGDLIFGSGAPTEVFPVVQRWLEGQGTPL